MLELVLLISFKTTSILGDATIFLKSAYLNSDIATMVEREKILDDVIFIDDGKIVLSKNADTLRQESGGSIDEEFRRMFKC